jgi:hypothetical protein
MWYGGWAGGGGVWRRAEDMEEASTFVTGVKINSTGPTCRLLARRENARPLPNSGFSLRSDLTLNSTAPPVLEDRELGRDSLFIVFILTSPPNLLRTAPAHTASPFTWTMFWHN